MKLSKLWSWLDRRQPAAAPARAIRRVAYRAALRTEKESRLVSCWPGRKSGNRLEPEAWPELRPKFSLTKARSIFTIGSCFARNIEERLHARGFEVPTLAFRVPETEWAGRTNGILNKFTPISIWQELEWTARAMAATGDERAAILGETLATLPGGAVVDLEMAGLKPVSRARGLERREQLLALYRNAFDCDVVVITPGVCEAWWDGARGRYIEEMPPRTLATQSPDRFQWEMLDFGTVHRNLSHTVELLRRHGRPEVKILLTVSPVPLKRTFSGQDVLIANTLAKSILRAAVGQVVAKHGDVGYVPTYESVTLSRSREIWANDLRHISTDFIARIVDRMIDAYFTSAPKPVMPESEPASEPEPETETQ